MPSLGPSLSRGMLREEHDLHHGQEDRGSLVPLLSAYSGAFEFMGLLDISNVITFIKPRSLNRRVFVKVSSKTGCGHENLRHLHTGGTCCMV